MLKVLSSTAAIAAALAMPLCAQAQIAIAEAAGAIPSRYPPVPQAPKNAPNILVIPTVAVGPAGQRWERQCHTPLAAACLQKFVSEGQELEDRS